LPKHVLIVDDDECLARLLSIVVKRLGGLDTPATVRLAGSGRLALQRIGEQRPDLVVLDLMLPDMNGDEVCRRLRADPATALLPVLIISGHSLAAQIAREAGATDYMPKPFDMAALAERIQDLLFDGEMAAQERAEPCA